jgi:Cytochrome P450
MMHLLILAIINKLRSLLWRIPLVWYILPLQHRKVTETPVAIEMLKLSTYDSRARANRHLRDAFGIMNPFVNGDKVFHDEYVKRVHRRLTQVTSNWSGVVDVTTNTASTLPQMNGIQEIRGAIRILVMSVALEIVGATGYTLPQLTRASELINDLWICAKKGLSPTPLREELHAILREWQTDGFVQELAEISSIPTERALLSILIPAYETMYRVILPLIYHTHKTITFSQFLTSKVSQSQLNSETGQGYTYLALIQETLRRYPVVKRIKRSTRWEDIAVDVEAIHLNPATWDNGEQFDPGRWKRVEGRGGFVPFGTGNGRCVANERIVGMVVCIVLGAVKDKLPGMEKQGLKGLLLNDREAQRV